MTIDLTSFTIGLVSGVVLLALMNLRTLRRMALTLRNLGVELGIEAYEDTPKGGVKIGDVQGGISGDIAGRDIFKNSNFFKNVMAAARSGSSGTVLSVSEHLKVEFPDTPDGRDAAAAVRRLGSQKAFFPTEASRRLLRPYIERFERDGWTVAAIRFSDTGNNGYHAEFQLQRSVNQNT